jgi:uncharacterized protein YigA (DUF484 family)
VAQHPDSPPKARGAKTVAAAPAGAKQPELAAADVAAFLRRHPDFLTNRPDLVAILTPPAREMGDGVVDLQRFMLERMRTDVARLKLVQRKLIATSRANLQNQSRVHGAVLAILAATTFEHLIAVVTEELTLLLDIDAVGLCVEATQGKRAPKHPVLTTGVQVLEAGAVDELLGSAHDVLLRSDVVGDPALFGAAAAGLVRSDALVRLRVSSAAPVGLLALGARKPGVFHPGQGTELLTFLAQVIEHSIRAWLDLPD